MPKINRAAVTLEVGESLRDLAKRVSHLDQFSGDARQRELRNIQLSLVPLSARLKQVIDNCRAAGGSYPNYPAVRKAIQEGGDQVYALRSELEDLRILLARAAESNPPMDNFMEFVSPLAKIGQQLKLVQFAPPLAQEQVNG